MIYRNELIKSGETKLFDNGENDFLFSSDKIWFAYARQALGFGLKILNIQEGDSVLVPEYICNVIESAFHENNIQIKYYKVLDDLSPDFNHLEKVVDSSNKALLYVNYFGFPAPYNEIKGFCDKHDLLTIEDNAHGFLCRYKEKWLGSFGDISITSVYKKLPLQHGAYLQINIPVKKINLPRFSMSENSIKHFYRYLKRYIQRNSNPDLQDYNFVWNNSDNEIPDSKMLLNINSYVKLFVKHLNIGSFLENRLKKYRLVIDLIESELKEEGKLLLNHPINGILPLQIPYLIEVKGSERDDFVKRLIKKGIEIFYWPDLPKRIILDNKEFKNANNYKHNCIHFPIC